MKLFKKNDQIPCKANFRFNTKYTFRVVHFPRFKKEDSNNFNCSSQVKNNAHLSTSETVVSSLNNAAKSGAKSYEKDGACELGMDNFVTNVPPLNLNSSFVKFSNNSIPNPNTSAWRLKSKRSLIVNGHSGYRKKNAYNSGRWSIDEHKRFVEAIVKFGNDWRNVQRYIRTRSSTQSRSHSQKFFMKLANLSSLSFKNITSLNSLAKTLNEKELQEMLNMLISCEYSDLKTECSQQKIDDDLQQSQKRKVTKVYDSNEAKLEENNNLPIHNPIGVFKDQAMQEPTIEEVNEEFQKQQFYSTFENYYHRICFEDNVFMLLAECIDKQG